MFLIFNMNQYIEYIYNARKMDDFKSIFNNSAEKKTGKLKFVMFRIDMSINNIFLETVL